MPSKTLTQILHPYRLIMCMHGESFVCINIMYICECGSNFKLFYFQVPNAAILECHDFTTMDGKWFIDPDIEKLPGKRVIGKEENS